MNPGHANLPVLLSKWLCHDLATPAATIFTASELLGPVGDAEINGLVQNGAQRLVARLRLVRTAFAPGGAPVSGAALERLVRGGIDGTPLLWLHPTGSTGDMAALIAGAAMLLADLARNTPLIVSCSSVCWDSPRPLPGAVAAALGGADAVDGTSAVAALVAIAATRAGVVAAPIPNGVGWD